MVDNKQNTQNQDPTLSTSKPEITVPNPNKPSQPSTNPATTTPTTAAPKTDDAKGTTLQRYDAADVASVGEAASAAAGKAGFEINKEEMEKLLQTTMVENKRPKKAEGALGDLWASMEPMMQKFMEMLMTAFLGTSNALNGGKGGAEDYSVMSSTSAAMSRVLTDIEGSGPGEGVFKGYKSKPASGKEGFTDDDLIKISVLNQKIKDAEKSGGNTTALQAEKEALSKENQQRFGLSSKEMWDVFKADKKTLMEQTVQSMAVEAQKNGLKDTSTDINRLMASYYSKGATERQIIDGMNQGVIPKGDISKVSAEDKQRLNDADISLGTAKPDLNTNVKPITTTTVSDVLPAKSPIQTAFTTGGPILPIVPTTNIWNDDQPKPVSQNKTNDLNDVAPNLGENKTLTSEQQRKITDVATKLDNNTRLTPQQKEELNKKITDVAKASPKPTNFADILGGQNFNLEGVSFDAGSASFGNTPVKPVTPTKVVDNKSAYR
jgi:hypothetical protein